MNRNATLPGMVGGSVLGPGAVVGGRFQVETLGTMVGQIPIYRAKDQRTQRPVALWTIAPGLLRPDVVTATRGAVKAAAAVTHKGVLLCFGSSVEPSGTLFVATEPLPATHVADAVKKALGGAPLSLAEALRALTPAFDALTATHAGTAHGALGPLLLRTDEAGHAVKVAGLGLSAALVAAHAVDPRYLAPEVQRGGPPSARADLYSLGAILYELCTGKAVDPAVSPCTAREGLPRTLDIIMESVLAEAPQDRFESVAEFKSALASLAAPTVPPPSADESVDVPIDFDEPVDAPVAAPAPAPTAPAPVSVPHVAPVSAPVSGAHVIGARVSLAHEPVPSPAADVSRMSSVDLKGLLDEATTNDAPRWMFVRGGLDHGPLSARELIQAIVKNEVTDQDIVFNMDSGERKKLADWPQYREFAEQAREKRKRDQHAREVRSAIAEDSTNTKAKSAVAIALVVMSAVVGVVYYKVLSPAARQARHQTELDDALAHGQLHLSEGGLQVLPAPPVAPSHSGGGGHGGGGGFAGSYEAAMNQPVEFNFGGAGPGGGTLSDREISGPLNAALGRFGSCATAEMARGGNVRQVQMRIAVGGSGAPIGVTVVSGSGAFKGCVGGIVRGLRWRAFGGPRVGFAWGFSLQ